MPGSNRFRALFYPKIDDADPGTSRVGILSQEGITYGRKSLACFRWCYDKPQMCHG